jgi:hypothetical protein
MEGELSVVVLDQGCTIVLGMCVVNLVGVGAIVAGQECSELSSSLLLLAVTDVVGEIDQEMFVSTGAWLSREAIDVGLVLLTVENSE